MPREQVEDIAVVEAGLAPEARWQRRVEPPHLPGRDLEGLVGVLSERLAKLPAESLDAALSATVETLGRGLRAERVGFYRPSSRPGGFDRSAVWQRDAEGAGQAAPDDSTFVLGKLPDEGAALLAGRTQLLGPCGGRGDGRGRIGRQIDLVRWTPLRSTLLLPCMGPDGLIGLLRVEAGLEAARWSSAVLASARLVGCLVSGFLERHRLAAELEAIRVRQGHDERLETLGRVASSVAHDFNNVLTAILGYAELLEMELPAQAEGREEVEEIHQAATRAADLVEQVLWFGRTRPGGVEEVDVDALLRARKSVLERVVGRGIEVIVEPRTAAAPSIRIDPARLERVLLNLASNARDAIHARGEGPGKLVFSTQRVEVDRAGRDSADPSAASRPIPGLRAGAYLRLSARDDGCGLEPGTAERVFEPFFTTKGAAAGTGLGLATAAEVVREARGGIRAGGDAGPGACFHLYFPLDAAGDSESAGLDSGGSRV